MPARTNCFVMMEIGVDRMTITRDTHTERPCMSETGELAALTAP